MTAHVYFSSHPSRTFSRDWWIALASGSPLTHVCFGDDEVVVHPSVAGVRYWPFEAFIRHFPGLQCGFAIDGEPDLTRFGKLTDKPQAMVPRFLRWLTRGAYPMMDCTAQASDMLRTIGVVVPRHVVTPIQLFRWLTQQGYRRTC